MRTLGIDLETYSPVDIAKCGLYKYVEQSEILLFAYSFNGEPAKIIDFTAGERPSDVLMYELFNPAVLKTAFNAAFEIHVINHWLQKEHPCGQKLDYSQWQCTMIQALSVGLPGSLADVGSVLNLGEDKQKLAIGKKLINKFCKPKPSRGTQLFGNPTRNMPEDYPEEWALFKEYCQRDVDSEQAIAKKLSAFPLSDRERRLWVMDQTINDRGVLIDTEVANGAIYLDDLIHNKVVDEVRLLTGIDNPKSNQQLLEWFTREEGYTPKTLDKTARAELIAGNEVKNSTREVLRYKNLLSKTSVKKYEAMINAMCEDGRVHGMLQFYGANRTGRWAGRLVQLHNLPQNHLEDLNDAREFIKAKDLEALEMFYDSPSDVLSQCIRTAFIARPGSRFIVADFSAIEARVIAWLADETWRQEAFAAGKDIYCASASQMFGVPVVKHGVNGELRQKGKIAELACGYGGGVNALKAFGADKMGLSEAAMDEIVAGWRKASPNICQFWRDIEKMVKEAIRNPHNRFKYKHGISAEVHKGILEVYLPSGRPIRYAKPAILTEEELGKQSVTYYGIGENHKWTRLYTWGGKLTENIVQATARDCLANAMLNLENAGYRIVMHVHDECICEMPEGMGSLEEAYRLMCKPALWQEGLLLNADGYETVYYRKD